MFNNFEKVSDLRYKYCPQCGFKLVKKMTGKNVFGEITYDLYCSNCKEVKFSWEDIYNVARGGYCGDSGKERLHSDKTK